MPSPHAKAKDDLFNPSNSLDMKLFMERTIKVGRKGKITDDFIIKFVTFINKGYDLKEISKRLEISEGSLGCLRREIRIAATKGMTLENYLRQGRKFKKGNTVMAK